ncbi:GIY-YIG nuclease family protein [Coxiella endosymbiont of Ornithodoros maritimus]|uniref:GIY-YIG nuclease family protein n=1 Tax=Coxiella endosymbiont of Ornithodoros maritimus TaxID=1656172 RepID=UPI0022643BD3|nr:GIY-YIG nuclease family protein [Coxiella endosymbiont of Ornithodoros maritimus]
MTSDLVKRIWGHKDNVVEVFTKEYKVHQLVYFELHEEMISVILHEKQTNKWNRLWKLRLIEKTIQNGETYIKICFNRHSPCVER